VELANQTVALRVLEKPAGARRVAAKLFDQFETLLLDLDGVIYEGKNAVAEAVESIIAVRSTGIKVGYITNNSSRKPETIADQLRGFGIELSNDDVISSAQAGVELLATMIPKGSKVLVGKIWQKPATQFKVGLSGLRQIKTGPFPAKKAWLQAMEL
jgi:hypothetical protein